jgi:hypothetical protein
VQIAGKPEAGELASAVPRLKQLLHRDVNYTVITDHELKRKLTDHDPLVCDIWQGKGG